MPVRLPPISGEEVLDWLVLGRHKRIILRRREQEILVYADLSEEVELVTDVVLASLGRKATYAPRAELVVCIGCLQMAMAADGWLEVTPRLYQEEFRLAFLCVVLGLEKLAARFRADLQAGIDARLAARPLAQAAQTSECRAKGGAPGLGRDELVYRVAMAMLARKMRAAPDRRVTWREAAQRLGWRHGSNQAGIKLLQDAQARLKRLEHDDPDGILPEARAQAASFKEGNRRKTI